jgi:hypothetical protein
MFIKSFGLFWRVDEVEWNPGPGARGVFRLLGRQGSNLPGLRLADFRNQQGIYILYNNHGAYYTGLTKRQGLGKRLKDHLNDYHADQWDRFSWFGFREVLIGRDKFGLCRLRDMANAALGTPLNVITSVEALLIRAMGLRNVNQMNFCNADQWIQIKTHEVALYMGKLAPRSLHKYP